MKPEISKSLIEKMREYLTSEMEEGEMIATFTPEEREELEQYTMQNVADALRAIMELRSVSHLKANIIMQKMPDGQYKSHFDIQFGYATREDAEAAMAEDGSLNMVEEPEEEPEDERE